MKRILPLILCLLLLTACAKTPDLSERLPEQPSSESAETAPEAEAADTPTAEPEAPAEEEKPADTAPEDSAAEKEETEAKPREPAAEKEEAEPEAEPEDAEEPPAAEYSLTVYRGNADATGLISEEVTVPQITAEEIVAQLIAAGVLPEDAAANSLAQHSSTLYLDMNGAFGAYLMGMGTAGEQITLGATVNTFLDAYGADELMLTVDGAAAETGHNVYDFALTRTESAEASGECTAAIYRGNADATGLVSEETTLPALTPECLIEALIAAGALPEGAAANFFDQDGSILYLDMNGVFLTYLQSMGTTGEQITLGALVNTFLDAFGASSLCLTAENGVIETGHNVYDLPLSFMR